MATINLGRVKPVFQGAYSGATAYVVDDIVTHDGNSYICILASTGNAPTNATYWHKMAQGSDLGSIAGLTTGDIVYYDGSAFARLALGSASEVLKVNSGATALEYGTGSKFLQAVHYHATSQNIGKPGASVTAYTAVGSSGYMAITPLSTTSKILITGGLTVSGGSNFHPSFMMQRDNSDGTGLVYVYGDNTSSSVGGVAFHGSTRLGINTYVGESADDTQKAIGINIIDSHNSSTTAIRYRVVVRDLNNGTTGSNAIHINRTGTSTGFADYTSHTIISLMEIEV